MKKLSILIPVYNVEKYLKRCLDSIYSQIDDNSEIVLIDDGSKDRSGEFCDEYASKYPQNTIVYHQKNEGAGSTRNKLIEKVNGEYFWFVDSDDRIEAGSIKHILDFIENDPDIDIISVAYKKIIGTSADCPLLNVMTNNQDIISGEEALLRNWFDPYLWSKVYRTKFIKGNSLHFNAKLNSQEDWLFNMYAFCKCKNIALTDIYAYNYYQDNTSSTLRNNSKEMRYKGVNNSLIAIQEFNAFVHESGNSKVYPILLNWQRYNLSGFLYSLYVIKLPISEISNIIDGFRRNNLYPVGMTDNKKSNLFLKVANIKFLFITICFFHKLISK
jgi:glycosyltransferase involved in cell wall biosynthesis